MSRLIQVLPLHANTYGFAISTTAKYTLGSSIDKVQHDLTLGPPKMRKYPPITVYRYLDLPSTQRIQTHKHNTTPPDPGPSRPPTLPNTIHTTATKHRHMSYFPISSRIGKAQTYHVTHSPPTPPTPPQAKHIHMPHTPPTPLTTLISSTSPALDKTPEPHVPPIYTLTATTPTPDPTPALPSSSHPHNIHTCNTNNSTVTATTAPTT